jgi:hypothetical protein
MRKRDIDDTCRKMKSHIATMLAIVVLMPGLTVSTSANSQSKPESFTGTIANRKSEEVNIIMDSITRNDEFKSETIDEETLKKHIDVVTQVELYSRSEQKK